MQSDNGFDKIPNKQFISFQLDQETYGLDVLLTESIETISNITWVPKTPSYVLGVINIRGDIIPVINLRKRLGMEEKEYDKYTRIVIATYNGCRVGLVVDKVKDVFAIPETQIQEGKNLFKDKLNDFILEIIRLENDYIMILDLKRILNLGDVL